MLESEVTQEVTVKNSLLSSIKNKPLLFALSNGLSEGV